MFKNYNWEQNKFFDWIMTVLNFPKKLYFIIITKPYKKLVFPDRIILY